MLEKASVLDLCVQRERDKSTDEERNYAHTLPGVSILHVYRPHGGPGWEDPTGSEVRQLRKMEISQAPWHIHTGLSINRLKCEADRW